MKRLPPLPALESGVRERAALYDHRFAGSFHARIVVVIHRVGKVIVSKPVQTLIRHVRLRRSDLRSYGAGS